MKVVTSICYGVSETSLGPKQMGTDTVRSQEVYRKGIVPRGGKSVTETIGSGHQLAPCVPRGGDHPLSTRRLGPCTLSSIVLGHRHRPQSILVCFCPSRPSPPLPLELQNVATAHGDAGFRNGRTGSPARLRIHRPGLCCCCESSPSSSV